MTTDFWLPQTAREDFRKAEPPKTGPAFGSWSGRDLSYLDLPGGGVLAFDLNRLTLSDYRSMRTHYQVNISLAVLMFMIHQQDWTIESVNGPKADRKIVDRMDRILRDAWTPLVRGTSQAHWAGFSPMALQYDNDGPSASVILSKVKDLVPEECRVNWEVVEGFAEPGHVRPQFFEYAGIVQSAWPSGYMIDGTGRFAGGGSYVIPPEYSLWYPLLMENGDFYGRKLLKPAFVPWFFSMLIHLFSNRYFERFGEPTPVGRANFDDTLTDDNGNVISGRNVMISILENLRSRGVVVLPSDRSQVGNSGQSEYDYDIQYLESQMRGADFERYLMRLDEEISIGMFTPLGAMRTGETGSHNSIQVQMQVYLWMLNALTGDMKYYYDNYLLNPLVDFNFGPNAPRMRWVPRKFGKDSAETLRFLLQEGVRVGDFKPDIVELGVACGITLEDTSMLVRADNQPIGPGEIVPGDPRAVNPNTPANPNVPANDSRSGRGTHGSPRKIAKTGDAGVIRSRMAARLCTQFQRAKREGQVNFVPDLGHGRQLADHLGDLEAAAEICTHLRSWATDVYPIVNSADEIGVMFQRVFDGELDD